MPDPLLTSVASAVARALVTGLATRARGYILGPEEEHALRGVFERALAAALEKTVEDVDPETTAVMQYIFGQWVSDAEVQEELLDSVTEVRQPSFELLRSRFGELNFEEETLRLDLDEMIHAFRETTQRELEAEVRLQNSVLSNMVTHDRLKIIYEAVRPSGNDSSNRRRGMLPRRPNLLVGRDREVEQLLQLLTSAAGTASGPSGAAGDEPQTVAVVGLPGVGKTSVAAELCHHQETRAFFTDDVLWASLGPSPDLVSIVSGWSRSVGGPDLEQSSSAEEASLRLAAFMRGKKVLVVADDVFEAEHAVVLKVIQKGALLVTSRAPAVARELVLASGDVYELGVLSEEESVELLGKVAPSLVRENRELCHELAQELGGLPLALRVAGGLLEEEAGYGWGITELLNELRDGKQLLQSKAPADTGILRSVVSPTTEALLQTSLERLDEDARKGFRRLGVIAAEPSTFDLEAAEKVWASTNGRDTMRTLVRQGLVEKASSGRFMVHPVLIMFAKHLLKANPQELRDAGKRHSRYFEKVLRRADELYLASGERARQGAQVLGVNWENIRGGWTWAESHSDEDEDAASLCVDYTDAGERWLPLRLDPEEHVSWVQAALRSARRLGDTPAEASNLVRLGDAYQRSSQHEEAKKVYETALDKYIEIEDRKGEGRALGRLGTCHKALGDPVSAEQYYRDQIQIAQDLGDLRSEAAGRGNLGVLFRDAGKHLDAIREISAGARIYQQLGDRREEAGASANLGTIYLEQQELDKAEQEQVKYLGIARELGDRDSECRALGNLGNVHRAREEYEAAAGCYEEALELARELGNPRYEGLTLGHIARVRAHLGNTEEALSLYESQLEIACFTKDRLVKAKAHNSLAALLRKEGKPKEALKHIGASLRESRKIRYPLGEADALWTASLIFADAGKLGAACARARQALDIYKKIEAPKARQVEEQLRRWREEDLG